MPGMKSVPLPEVAGLIRKLPEKYAAIVAIGVTTGCRITEILELRRFHLLRPDGTLKERIAFLKLKTRSGNKSRKLSIPEDFRVYILRHLDTDAEKGYERPDDWVFRGQNGNHLSRLTVYHFFRERLGMGYGTHWMRKTFAQELFRYFLENNIRDPMRALELTRRALAHERIDTTIRYLGINEQSIDEAQNSIFNLQKIKGERQ